MIRQIILVDPDGTQTLQTVRWTLRPFSVQIDGRDFVPAGLGSDGIWRYQTKQPRLGPPPVAVTLERLNHQRTVVTVPGGEALPETVQDNGIMYRLDSIQGDDTRPRYREQA